MIWTVLKLIFVVVEIVSFGMIFYFSAAHKIDDRWKNYVNWNFSTIASGAGFLASSFLADRTQDNVPVFLMWIWAVACTGYLVYCWVKFFFDQKRKKE